MAWPTPEVLLERQSHRSYPHNARRHVQPMNRVTGMKKNIREQAIVTDYISHTLRNAGLEVEIRL